MYQELHVVETRVQRGGDRDAQRGRSRKMRGIVGDVPWSTIAVGSAHGTWRGLCKVEGRGQGADGDGAEEGAAVSAEVAPSRPVRPRFLARLPPPASASRLRPPSTLHPPSPLLPSASRSRRPLLGTRCTPRLTPHFGTRDVTRPSVERHRPVLQRGPGLDGAAAVMQPREGTGADLPCRLPALHMYKRPSVLVARVSCLLHHRLTLFHLRCPPCEFPSATTTPLEA